MKNKPFHLGVVLMLFSLCACENECGKVRVTPEEEDTIHVCRNIIDLLKPTSDCIYRITAGPDIGYVDFFYNRYVAGKKCPKNFIPYTVIALGGDSVKVSIPIGRASGSIKDLRDALRISIIDPDSTYYHWWYGKGNDHERRRHEAKMIPSSDLSAMVKKFYDTNRLLSNYGSTIIERQTVLDSSNRSIKLIITDSKLEYFDLYVEKVVRGYLSFAHQYAQNHFQKELCDLSRLELDSLKNQIPLIININWNAKGTDHIRLLELKKAYNDFLI